MEAKLSSSRSSRFHILAEIRPTKAEGPFVVVDDVFFRGDRVRRGRRCEEAPSESDVVPSGRTPAGGNGRRPVGRRRRRRQLNQRGPHFTTVVHVEETLAR